MIKIIKNGTAVLSLFILATCTFAAKEGAYAGLGLGASKLLTPNLPSSNELPVGAKATKKFGGLGERVFAGYNFNPYFGIESGLAHYAPTEYKFSAIGHPINQSIHYYLNAVDVVAKGYLPISSSGFNVYGLAGAAYVDSKVESKVSASNKTLDKFSESQNKLRPIYGAGISYDFPKSPFTTTLEYSHIQGSGDLKRSVKAVPSANLVSLNLAYSFN